MSKLPEAGLVQPMAAGDPANSAEAITGPGGLPIGWRFSDGSEYYPCIPRYRNGELSRQRFPSLGVIKTTDAEQRVLDLAGKDENLRAALAELVRHADGDQRVLHELYVLIATWQDTPHHYSTNGGWCGTWLSNFFSRLPEEFRGPVGTTAAGDNILKVTPSWFQQGDPSFLAGLGTVLAATPAGHYAARIKFPDGYVVYLDNGWAGTGGIFGCSAATHVPCSAKFIHSPVPTTPPEPGWPE